VTLELPQVAGDLVGDGVVVITRADQQDFFGWRVFVAQASSEVAQGPSEPLGDQVRQGIGPERVDRDSQYHWVIVSVSVFGFFVALRGHI
jgi:hypothetical protein